MHHLKRKGTQNGGCQEPGRGSRGRFVFNGYRAYNDERVLEKDGGDGCTAM